MKKPRWELKKKKYKKTENRLQSSILSLWKNHQEHPYTLDQIVQLLAPKNKASIPDFRTAIEGLVRRGGLSKIKDKYYRKAHKKQVMVGQVDHVSQYHAYLIVSGEEQDIYVKTQNLSSAVHNDTVEVMLLPYKRNGRLEGHVTQIIKRHRHRLVGRIAATRGEIFIIPDFKKIYQDFFLPQEQATQATINDKVVFEVLHWGDENHNAEGRIIEVLGKTGENEAEIHSIMSEFDLPFRFAPSILQEAEKIDSNISPAEIKKRRDFREVLTFTIDPDDAKDFDDAISFKKIENGHYEIGVHIADVSHYVQPNTAIDQDAYHRATSVYLVDRTIPMLPERLSNQLCSLVPQEDRLSFSVMFEIDAEANIHREWFGKTIIHSNHRFTYEQAQQAIETEDGDYAHALTTLNKMAIRMREKRIENGAIDFETTEVKFVLDKDKKPIQALAKERKDAHKLVEEFMLLANKAVASYVFKQINKTENIFVYRAHDSPDQEKVVDFAHFAKQFGHRINTEEKEIAHSINALIYQIEGKPEQNALQQLAIRTMAKAKYTTEPKGHFGLAFLHYTHFTSPIRRYPDLIVHRMLQGYLSKKTYRDKGEYEVRCVHCSEREKRASNAERASVKYKQVEFMSLATNKDKVYEGIITGVSDFGIFIEIIETRCEGMAKLRDMKDDFYELDEKKFRVVGRRKKKVYRLGDNVPVRVKKTDIDRRIIDLSIVR